MGLIQNNWYKQALKSSCWSSSHSDLTPQVHLQCVGTFTWLRSHLTDGPSVIRLFKEDCATVKFIFIMLFVTATPLPKLAAADLIYTIGNSLTWDTKPPDLDGIVDYQIYCAKNLQYIQDNPEGHCVRSSLPWTTALTTKQYDWISVQPFSGTKLSTDSAIISSWMSLQPDATFVIHPAWTGFTTFPRDYEAGNPDNKMRPSPEYISDLISELQTNNPGREIRSTKTNDLLYSIYLDVEHRISPFNSLLDLSRDYIHMGLNTGRYLAHNALRISMDQPLSDGGFTMDPGIQSYLDRKLTGAPGILSDFNNDRLVNIQDFAVLAGLFGCAADESVPAETICSDADLAPVDMPDGVVDIADFAFFSTQIGLGYQTPSGILGDFNNDSTVDIKDFALFTGLFGCTVDELEGRGTTCTDVDLAPVNTPDGIVNITDFALFSTQIGQGNSAASASTPEPATFLLLGLGIAFLGWRKRTA